jgi:hypothetical protein
LKSGIGSDSEEVVTVWCKYYHDIFLEELRTQQETQGSRHHG